MTLASRRLSQLAPAIALVAGLMSGCASAPRPVANSPSPNESPAAPAPAAAEPSKLPPKTVVVRPIPPAGQGPATLAEAAAAERRRREALEQKSSVVINDKNLAAWAAKGQVTEARPTPGEAPAEATPLEPPPAEGAAVEPPRDEAYWRAQALSIRERWRQAHDAIGALEQRAADLRWQFYAEDDAYYRDSTIKPQWDRALEDLRGARREVEESRAALERLLEDGSKANALPGWLREGVELEPPEEPARREPASHDTIEPPIVDPEGP